MLLSQDPVGNGLKYPFQIYQGGVAYSGTPKDEDISDYYRAAVIRQAIWQILITDIGEWIDRRKFGSATNRLPFATLPEAKGLVEQRVVDALMKFEKRITGVRTFTRMVPEEGKLEVDISYTIIRTGSSDTMTYPWYLEHAGA